MFILRDELTGHYVTGGNDRWTLTPDRNGAHRFFTQAFALTVQVTFFREPTYQMVIEKA